MKKFLSILLIVLLSAVAVFAAGVFDGKRGNGGSSNPPGSNEPTMPPFITEGPNPINPPLINCFQMAAYVSGHTYDVRIALCMMQGGQTGGDVYAFYLYVDTPLPTDVPVLLVNQTTGETHTVVFEGGTTSCWVPLGNALGSWMVRFGSSNYGYFTVTNSMLMGAIVY
ncbi:MAG: hypothetical protein J6W98_04540 [Bacteroidales bacterium]|nr:hypothetical protein [Bacteroidales bacterium]